MRDCVVIKRVLILKKSGDERAYGIEVSNAYGLYDELRFLGFIRRNNHWVYVPHDEWDMKDMLKHLVRFIRDEIGRCVRISGDLPLVR